MSEIQSSMVRRRIEFILFERAGNSVSQMSRQTGLPRNLLNNALNPNRETLSTDTASRICAIYGVTLDFVFWGYRTGLDQGWQDLIDRWIEAGRWDIERRAPREDRQK